MSNPRQVVEFNEERDRRICIALDAKVTGANRELAQWLVDNPRYSAPVVAEWLNCGATRIQDLRAWAKKGFEGRPSEANRDVGRRREYDANRSHIAGAAGDVALKSQENFPEDWEYDANRSHRTGAGVTGVGVAGAGGTDAALKSQEDLPGDRGRDRRDRGDATLKSQENLPEDDNDVIDPKELRATLLDQVAWAYKNAELARKLIKASRLESDDELRTAIDRLIFKWKIVRSTFARPKEGSAAAIAAAAATRSATRGAEASGQRSAAITARSVTP